MVKFENLRVIDLKERCKERGLVSTGNKSRLIEILRKGSPKSRKYALKRSDKSRRVKRKRKVKRKVSRRKKSSKRRKKPSKRRKKPSKRRKKSSPRRKIKQVLLSEILESPKKEGDCIERSNMPLRSLQKKIVEFIKNPKNESLLVVHSTGCGKTLTAVTASQCYLDINPTHKVVVVTPASLVENFKKELRAYGVTNFDKYEFFSFTSFMNLYKKDEVNCKNKMLIVDEVHNARAFLTRDPKIKKMVKGKTYASILECSRRADKRLLLTATPFINKPTDFVAIINFLYGKPLVGTKGQYKDQLVRDAISDSWKDVPERVKRQDMRIISYYLKGKVDYHMKCEDDPNYPKLREHYKSIPMSEDYFQKYISLIGGSKIEDLQFKFPDAYYNAYRRAVNKIGKGYYSSKIKSILPILKKGKALIYTNWIDFGLKPISNFLKQNGITYEVFYGSLSKERRKEIVDAFNENKFQVLIVTKAGGEGLDLKEVRNVIIIDPVWNDSGLRQIIGRAVRYRSHIGLPEKDRRVDVWKLVLVSPDKTNWEDDYISGDAILYKIIERKKEDNKEIDDLLSKLSN